MPTTTRFAVAVHTLTNLAVAGGRPMRSEDLAYSASTGAVVIRGLLSRLSDAGLTRSQMGAGGGAMLTKPAEDITLLDVYRAVEDPELFSLHRTPPCENCAVGGNIAQAMAPTLSRARKALEDELARVSIADIAAEVARLGHFTIHCNGDERANTDRSPRLTTSPSAPLPSRVPYGRACRCH